MGKEKINILQHGFIRVPRLAFKMLYGGELEQRRCAMVYIYLLFKAYFFPGRMRRGSRVVRIERGESIMLRKELSVLLDMSRFNLDKVLDKLEALGLIQIIRHFRYSIFRIVDYERICSFMGPVSLERSKKMEVRKPDSLLQEEWNRRFREWKSLHRSTEFYGE